MELRTLFPILKKHLAEGADVPYFFRDLVAMMTDVTEDEWGTKKDPSTRETKDDTIRKYAMRGLSKSFAQSIVYRLTPNNLIDRISAMPEAARSLMADDFRGYSPSVDENNVGETIAKWLCEIIQTDAGMVQQEKLEKQKQSQLSMDLKNQYGEYLLNEAHGYCPVPGCGNPLVVAQNGKITNCYEISLIDKGKPPMLENLLAMCPRCHATYQLDDNKQLTNDLQAQKAILVAQSQSARMLDDLPLERGITKVIQKVTALKEKDLVNAELSPNELTKKIKPEENMALYISVKSYVSLYYVRLKEIMMNLDKRGEIDYDEVQDQMKAIYRRLKKSKRTKVEVFNEIAAKIHRASLQQDVYCQIVVAYFVQSCEVFDAITE